MKYKNNHKVYYADKKYLIVGTKETPYKPNVDVYNRPEIYPTKDYLILRLENIIDGICYYSGIVDVNESEIEDKNW